MSGILRRTKLLSNHKDGVYETGWSRVVTGIGNMVEPIPFQSIIAGGTDDYDATYDDMISHVDDVDFIEYDDKNLLSGTVSDVAGGADGWTHGGHFILRGN